MKNNITIDKIQIGKNAKPMIVAEMSGNHNQSLDKALQIVEEVAKTGAHALKMQTYTADTLTIDKKDGDFFLGDKIVELNSPVILLTSSNSIIA